MLKECNVDGIIIQIWRLVEIYKSLRLWKVFVKSHKHKSDVEKGFYKEKTIVPNPNP
jgi:hypothetical protein